MPSKIETELCAKTSLNPPKTAEQRPAFLEKVIKAVTKMSDTTFDKLSPAARAWANKASPFYDANKKIPDFADYKPEAAKASSATNSKAKPAAKAAPAKKPAVALKVGKLVAADKPPPEPRKLTRGAPTLLKQMILKTPDLTRDEIVDKLKGKGIKVSKFFVQTQRNDFRHSIRVIQDAGLLKKEFNV